MCFKNEERYLEQTLDSIVKQTEKNFELIAIDDHSTDKSLEIISNYAKVDSRITVFSNKAEGVIKGLQKAFKESHGVRAKEELTY